jgi:hypothetical protein
MFADNVLFEAGHCLYALEFADELERRGSSLGAVELTTAIEPLSPAEHGPVIRPLVATIDESLGASVESIFRAGGIPEDKFADALGDLLLGVKGHGVSIHDSYHREWEAGCKALRVTGRLPYNEMTEYFDLAYAKLNAAGYPDNEDGEDRPVIQVAFDWHGGQSSALYAFASTRNVQSEDHRGATLAEIAICKKNAAPDDVGDLGRLEETVRTIAVGEKVFFI